MGQRRHGGLLKRVHVLELVGLRKHQRHVDMDRGAVIRLHHADGRCHQRAPVAANSRIPGPLVGHDVHLANAHGTLWCAVGCKRGHTPGPIRVAEDKKSEEDFEMDDRAMEFLEEKLLKLYETLPRKDRIDLKENGTVAVGAVRKKGKKPR